jgi:hypothetical protein
MTNASSRHTLYAGISSPRPPAPIGSSGDKGHVLPGALLRAFAFAAVGACALFAFSHKAYATPDQSQFGRCWGDWCLGPAVALTLGEYNFYTKKFSGGIIPGVGYGVTWDGPINLQAAVYVSFLVGQGQPNQLAPSLILSIFNYIQVGAGPEVIEQPTGPTQTQWRILFGLGTNFGATQKQAKDLINTPPPASSPSSTPPASATPDTPSSTTPAPAPGGK